MCLGLLIDRWEYAVTGSILWLESYLDNSATVREGKICGPGCVVTREFKDTLLIFWKSRLPCRGKSWSSAISVTVRTYSYTQRARVPVKDMFLESRFVTCQEQLFPCV